MKYSIRKLKSDAQRTSRPKVCRAELVGLAIRDEDTLEATFELEGVGEEGAHLRLMFSVEDGDCLLLPDFASRLTALLTRRHSTDDTRIAELLRDLRSANLKSTTARNTERDCEIALRMAGARPKEVTEARGRILAYLAGKV